MTDVVDDYADPYFRHLRSAKDRKSVVKLPEVRRKIIHCFFDELYSWKFFSKSPMDITTTKTTTLTQFY